MAGVSGSLFGRTPEQSSCLGATPRSAQRGTITLLYSARDPERNNAVVLRAFLEEQLSQRQRWDEERSAPSSLLQREARIEDKWSSR
ncbi:MAG: DUF488 family protein [Thermomicrobium sp.]|nr:DUF488 family protein [Thermomicrobium sp.]MBO9385974.1 DUF488 family protein [Thermomicrobium sp.]